MSRKINSVWLLIIGILGLSFLFIPFSEAFLDVKYDYTMRTVAIGGAVLGVVSGVLGSFAVLRGQSLMGDALSHSALPGVAIAFLLMGRELSWLLLGAGIASWVSVMVISAIVHTTRIKQDTAMGIVLASFFAFGIALLAYIQSRPDASQAGLDKFILGQAAAIVERDVQLIGGVGLAAILIVVAFWKEFKLITFDSAFAGANGYPVRWLDMLLSTLIVIAIVLGLQLAGVILMIGLLIAPAVAARQWTHDLGQMIVLSAIFGGVSGAIGSIISGIDADLPTGPLIVVVASLIVFTSLFLAPNRGLLWRWLQAQRDRDRFAAQHVLRDIYRHALVHQDLSKPLPMGTLITSRKHIAGIGTNYLIRDKLITSDDRGGWMLTEIGIKRAQEDARNQELWSLYRQYGDELQLPIVQEDRQKDIHQLLPNDAVRKLENLQLKGGGANV